jgi:regulation of enolase protein 1 (concanavalin A-like superfamily)
MISDPFISDAPSHDGEPQRPALAGWGIVVDPDGDCVIGLENDTLTIKVPGKNHDLSIEVNNMNAPRVMRAIEGDFIAQLKVSGKVRHTGGRASEHFYAYHGAGLLLWKDERTYIRLERAALNRDQLGVFHYASFELRKDGNRVRTQNPAFKIPDQDMYLRLERRGDRVFGSFSADGVRWSSFEPHVLDLPARLTLGVAAISTSTEVFQPEFSDFEVFRKESKQRVL